MTLQATLGAGAEPRVARERDSSVPTFTAAGTDYYAATFERIEKNVLPLWHINRPALLVPWFWAGWRGVWLVFWLALAVDLLGIVCLMQVIKFSPLLAAAEANAADNATLVERYSRWITNFGTVGVLLLVFGRLAIASGADRWYYRQYSRWRIDASVPSGVSGRRLLLAGAMLLAVSPLTIYRATQLRLDERACLNLIRAGEATEALRLQAGFADAAALAAALQAELDRHAAEFARVDAIPERTPEENTRRAELRKLVRDTTRDLETVRVTMTTGAREKFDCWFIDDFPTIARLDPPEDVVYRRTPDEEAIAAGEAGATRVVRLVKDPVEGRRVNIFTYSAESIDISINFLRANFATIFDAMTHVLRQSLIRVEILFMQTPWPVVCFLFLVLAWRYTGRATTVFVGGCLAFLALFELWQVAMQTMALVVVSTALCILVGLPVGIWMAKNRWARWITEPILDVMQTIPSLSYLVPAVAFFGISQPPAVLATVVFAMPPMIKLTALGIRQVPESTKEAGLAFGASERQLLTRIELPMAIPSIMAGLNQTIMLALSMATISAFIGAEGLGAIVTAALGDAQAGKGLLAGIAIALVAMMIDRILKGIRASFSRI